MTEYDEMPYFCAAFSETHPNRLATLGTLFGMSVAPVNKCRVLELGCGTGGNLVPMAYGLPGSEFVGVDLSIKEIESARGYVDALQLKNIQFRQADILDIDESYGKFDYIMAHGVYSWVPAEVRKKILAIFHDNLQPNGIAYVSYNVYPGWHFYNMVREMMRYHIRNIKNIPQAVQAARQFIQQLEASTANDKISYKELLRQEVNRIQKMKNDDYIWHDVLSEVNQPCYFHEFIEQISGYKLQYLSDADFQTMVPNNFSSQALEFLQNAAKDNILDIEQYMDFVRNRPFRESLLCHQDVKLNRDIDLDYFRSFYYTIFLKPVSLNPDIRSTKPEEFVGPHGNKVTINNPSAKASWCYLASRAPQQVSFSELLDGINILLGNDHVIVDETAKVSEIKEQLLEHLWWCYSNGYIRIYMQRDNVSLAVEKFPLAAPFSRYEAARQLIITNLIHEPVEIDNLAHHILPLLDGKHDRAAIVKVLADLVAKGVISVQESGEAVTEPDKINELLLQRLNKTLDRCVQVGLLMSE